MSAPIAPGEVIAGKYRVEEVIGEGGMGVVVAAWHLQLERRVALKLIRGAASEADAARLGREARAAAAIRSEHVARVLDTGALPSGEPYIVMEHLEGADLGRVVAERGALPVEEAVELVLQACEAIAEAHAAGVVHRDLKPSNLFLTRRADGTPVVKVLDFGISKIRSEAGSDAAPRGGARAGPSLTRPGAAPGSPRYMAPEQVLGSDDVDARSDIWALGVVLQELLGGGPAFDGDSAEELRDRILHDPPTSVRLARPEVPVALEVVLLRCLEKDPARRPPSVAELAAALAPFAARRALVSVGRIAATLAEPSTTPPRPEPPAPRPAPPAPRRRRAAATAALLALGIGGAVLAARTGPETGTVTGAGSATGAAAVTDAAAATGAAPATEAELERILEALLREGTAPGSPRARIGAEARLALAERELERFEAPPPARTMAEWSRPVDAIAERAAEIAALYAETIAWQHADLAQCAMHGQGRAHERAAELLLALPAPPPPTPGENGLGSPEEALGAHRARARAELVLAELAYRAAAMRPAPAGAGCRERALRDAERLAARLAAWPG